jgi:replication fork protection complex subunit Tof1/Swi1
VGEQRRNIIIIGSNGVDELGEDDDDDGDGDKTLRKDRPSAETMKTITNYGVERYLFHFSLIVELNCMKWFFFFFFLEIPYVNDEHANAATKNPELKLLFRLCRFDIVDEGEFVDVDVFVFFFLKNEFLIFR